MADKKLKQTDKRYHENIFKKTINSILVGIIIAISHLPFWILFGISDFIYIIVRYVVKYRYKVIIENLSNAFPDKNKTEIKKITNKFYHHFCDLFVETIKSYSINSAEMSKRMKFNNIDILNDHFDKGKSVVLLGMHYNNWEWNSSMPIKCKHQVSVVYNPLRGNNAFEKFILKTRTRWGCKMIPVNQTRRIVLDIAKAKIPVALALGADQTAPATSKFWTPFFNREAPFFSGPEKIAHSLELPVFFTYSRKVKRGMYEVDYILLFENPKEVDPNEILLTYIRKIEELVSEEPAYYLWSHRRWKHTRPEGTPLL
ncbi:MAG: lysophospholipid acyltransferase family protein [Draconibacterium sp.]|nr:lysophospholipid acyltransferase family protein [Draconibacterium sp.]